MPSIQPPTTEESPNSSLSKSQPNMQVVVLMTGSTTTGSGSSFQEKGTSTSDLGMEGYKAADDEEDEDENLDTLSSCSAGTNSSCGSSFREDCPHCVIRSNTCDSVPDDCFGDFV